jgi:branched-chain amino acid transport system permease protein
MHDVIQHAINAVSVGALYALYALGVALIFSVMRLVNFAQGELIMVGGYALVQLAGVPWPVQLLLAVVCVVVVALVLERVAFRPVRGADPTTLLITSFAVSYLLQNLALMVFGSLPKGVDITETITSSFTVAGYAVTRLQVTTVLSAIVLLGGLTLFLLRTPLGVQIRATAENLEAARLTGVRINRVIAVAFGLSGLLAGVASILLVAQTGTVTSTIGLAPVLIAFIATVVGGMGSLTGAALGGFALGVVTVVLQVTLPEELRSSRDAFLFGLVILVLVFRPQGLISHSSAAREV